MYKILGPSNFSNGFVFSDIDYLNNSLVGKALVGKELNVLNDYMRKDFEVWSLRFCTKAAFKCLVSDSDDLNFEFLCTIEGARKCKAFYKLLVPLAEKEAIVEVEFKKNMFGQTSGIKLVADYFIDAFRLNGGKDISVGYFNISFVELLDLHKAYNLSTDIEVGFVEFVNNLDVASLVIASDKPLYFSSLARDYQIIGLPENRDRFIKKFLFKRFEGSLFNKLSGSSFDEAEKNLVIVPLISLSCTSINVTIDSYFVYFKDELNPRIHVKVAHVDGCDDIEAFPVSPNEHVKKVGAFEYSLVKNGMHIDAQQLIVLWINNKEFVGCDFLDFIYSDDFDYKLEMISLFDY